MAIPDPRNTARAVSDRKTPVERAYCNLVSTVTAAPAASMRPAVMSHGAKAHGDGWLADMLIRRPSSLRELKIKNGGTFPRQ